MKKPETIAPREIPSAQEGDMVSSGSVVIKEGKVLKLLIFGLFNKTRSKFASGQLALVASQDRYREMTAR